MIRERIDRFKQIALIVRFENICPHSGAKGLGDAVFFVLHGVVENFGLPIFTLFSYFFFWSSLTAEMEKL